jgi:hypothetical protein
MDDTPCQRFFQEPSCTAQRQYEALRAVFLEHSRQKDVAERFGYDYDAFRQLVGQFRAACAAGQPPPFSTPPGQVGRRIARPPLSRSGQPPPIAAPSAWPQGDASGLGLPASSSSCPCWPSSASMTSSAKQATPAHAWSLPPLRCYRC